MLSKMKVGLVLSTFSSSVLATGLLVKRQQMPTGDVCRLWDHRSAMINEDLVYIDWSLSTYVDTVGTGYMYYSYPFFVKLSESFDTQKLDPGISAYIEFPDNPEVPITTKGAVWADKAGDIIKYGGYYPLTGFWGNSSRFTPHGSDMWKLDTETYNWTKLPPASGDPISGTRNAGTTFISELDLGFAAGGHLSNQTDEKFESWDDGEAVFLNSMVTYNMGNSTWRNQTTDMAPFTLSTLVHVPVGPQGLLVSLGGYDSKSGFYKVSATDNEITSRDLDSVYVYDVEKQTWVSQRTTGQTPRNRLSFCAVMAVASDKSSYNLILHGGISFEDNFAFADTYVLSMPSFQWVKLDEGKKGMERLDHTCHLSKNKMVIFGGKNVDQDNPRLDNLPLRNGDCDPTSFINIFDVNTQKWETKWDPAAREDFKVPAPVIEVIGGDGMGCATVQEPEAGWASTRVRALFGNYTAASDCAERESTRTVNGDSGTSTSSSSPTPGSGSIVSPKDSLFYLGLLSLAALVPYF